MEMIKITDRAYYIKNPANIGVIKNGEGSVILIDSGIDSDTGRKILSILEKERLSVKAIINTHSHADHCGGNSFIKQKTGATVYAPELESAIIEHPFLEPLYLFSGARPLRELQNKFLMAQPSGVDYVIKKEERKIRLGGLELGIVPLAGHSHNQIGIEFDNVLFCADSIFSEEVINKHKIAFFTDIGRAKETLEFLKNSGYDFYVPSHAEPCKNLAGLAEANLKSIRGVEDYIVQNLAPGRTTEQVLSEMCSSYGISLNSAQQYYLMLTVTMAYLGSLHETGKVELAVRNNSLLWNIA